MFYVSLDDQTLARAYAVGVHLLLHPDSDILAHHPYDTVAVFLPSAEKVLRETLRRMYAALVARGLDPVDALYKEV